MVREGQRLAFTLMYLANISEDRQIALALRWTWLGWGWTWPWKGCSPPATSPG